MVKNKYDQVFKVEIDGWCYGLERYPGDIYPELVHGIIRELKGSFDRAIRHNLAFDIMDISARICKSAKYLVPQKEIVFSLLVNLPSPNSLSSDMDAMYTLANIIDKVEQVYPGALDRLQKRWKRVSATA